MRDKLGPIVTLLKLRGELDLRVTLDGKLTVDVEDVARGGIRAPEPTPPAHGRVAAPSTYFTSQSRLSGFQVLRGFGHLASASNNPCDVRASVVTRERREG